MRLSLTVPDLREPRLEGAATAMTSLAAPSTGQQKTAWCFFSGQKCEVSGRLSPGANIALAPLLESKVPTTL
jgi:hypothetical protein